MSRFFHALVVFGAGVSVSSCGGKTQEEAVDGDPSAGASGSQAGGSLAGGNQSGGNQAGGSIDFGGNAGTGAGIADGSTVGGGDLPDGGTLAQWTCEFSSNACRGVAVVDGSSMRGYSLAGPCALDPTRPRTAEDCPGNQWFECLLGVWMGQPVAVSCACVPMTDTGCDSDTCATFGGANAPVTCFDHSKLCGCAYTGILK